MMNRNLKARSQHFQNYISPILIWGKNSHKIQVTFSILILLKKGVLEALRELDFILEGKEGQSKMSWASRGL